jgi:hypothetical protein
MRACPRGRCAFRNTETRKPTHPESWGAFTILAANFKSPMMKKPTNAKQPTLAHLKGSLGVRERRPVTLVPVRFLEQPADPLPDAPEKDDDAVILLPAWPWLSHPSARNDDAVC